MSAPSTELLESRRLCVYQGLVLLFSRLPSRHHIARLTIPLIPLWSLHTNEGRLVICLLRRHTNVSVYEEALACCHVNNKTRTLNLRTSPIPIHRWPVVLEFECRLGTGKSTIFFECTYHPILFFSLVTADNAFNPYRALATLVSKALMVHKFSLPESLKYSSLTVQEACPPTPQLRHLLLRLPPLFFLGQISPIPQPLFAEAQSTAIVSGPTLAVQRSSLLSRGASTISI